MKPLVKAYAWKDNRSSNPFKFQVEGEESGEYVFRLFLIYSNLSLSSLMQSAEVLHGACSGWEHDAFITSSPGGEVSLFSCCRDGEVICVYINGKVTWVPPVRVRLRQTSQVLKTDRESHGNVVGLRPCTPYKRIRPSNERGTYLSLEEANILSRWNDKA